MLNTLMLRLSVAVVALLSTGQQGNEAPMAIKKAALAAFVAQHASAGGSPKRVAFDPVIVRGWYDSVMHTEATPVRHRDSTEIAQLASVVGGPAVGERELLTCTRDGRGATCRVPPLETITIAVGEPHLTGSTATVLLASQGAWEQNGRLSAARSGTSSVARLAFTNGAWTVRCTTAVGTDYAIPAATVNRTCPP
jgi:hypothetical protein